MKAGINPRLISTPLSRVSDNQMTLLVQLIWETLADEFMGFTPTPCKQGAFTLMAQSVSQCKNLREALQLGTHFYNYITDDITKELIESETQAHLSVVFTTPELDPEHFYQDFWLITWHRFASWLTGRKIPLIETALTYSKPTNSSELHYLFPGSHRFNSHKNQLTFNAEYLNLPLVRSKSELTTFLMHSPADLMTIPGDDNSLSHTIIQLIKNFNHNITTPGLTFPTITEIAQQLHLTPITLHRKLKTEGSNYQQIKENIRRDIALTKLVKERLKVKEVAAIVGFSESSSFTRAFKLWTGLTPREYCRFIDPA